MRAENSNIIPVKAQSDFERIIANVNREIISAKMKKYGLEVELEAELQNINLATPDEMTVNLFSKNLQQSFSKEKCLTDSPKNYFKDKLKAKLKKLSVGRE